MTLAILENGGTSDGPYIDSILHVTAPGTDLRHSSCKKKLSGRLSRSILVILPGISRDVAQKQFHLNRCQVVHT